MHCYKAGIAVVVYKIYTVYVDVQINPNTQGKWQISIVKWPGIVGVGKM